MRHDSLDVHGKCGGMLTYDDDDDDSYIVRRSRCNDPGKGIERRKKG